MGPMFKILRLDALDKSAFGDQFEIRVCEIGRILALFLWTQSCTYLSKGSA
jgi:hypothetical protein